jgi:DNA polymerase
LGEALLRLEAAGFNILFHVHDEVICLFPKYSAEKDLQRMIKIMEVVPDWAQSLPIAVEGTLSERYKK